MKKIPKRNNTFPAQKLFFAQKFPYLHQKRRFWKKIKKSEKKSLF
jgi:hypothetical protein